MVLFLGPLRRVPSRLTAVRPGRLHPVWRPGFNLQNWTLPAAMAQILRRTTSVEFTEGLLAFEEDTRDRCMAVQVRLTYESRAGAQRGYRESPSRRSFFPYDPRSDGRLHKPRRLLRGE
jgi:hypothetical protein